MLGKAQPHLTLEGAPIHDAHAVSADTVLQHRYRSHSVSNAPTPLPPWTEPQPASESLAASRSGANCCSDTSVAAAISSSVAEFDSRAIAAHSRSDSSENS